MFTGGDPMMSRHLFDLIEYADQAGLRCSPSPPRPLFRPRRVFESLHDYALTSDFDIKATTTPMSAGSPCSAESRARSAAPVSPSTTA